MAVEPAFHEAKRCQHLQCFVKTQRGQSSWKLGWRSLCSFSVSIGLVSTSTAHWPSTLRDAQCRFVSWADDCPSRLPLLLLALFLSSPAEELAVRSAWEAAPSPNILLRLRFLLPSDDDDDGKLWHAAAVMRPNLDILPPARSKPKGSLLSN